MLYFWHRVGNGLLTLMSDMLTDLNLTDMETRYKMVRTDLMRALPLARVRRWLSADWEPAPAIAALPNAAALIRRGGGRMLRCSCFYEDFIKTVLTINANWSATRRMVAALVAEPGGGSLSQPPGGARLW